LKGSEVKEQFNDCLDRKLSEAKETWTGDVDSNWSLISTEFTEAAEEVLGQPPAIKRNDWFDDECREWAQI
jgi:hypothetical protein